MRLLELGGLSYKERLVRSALFALKPRRMRGDLMEVMRGIDKVNCYSLFPRVGCLKLEGKGLIERVKSYKEPEGQFFNTEVDGYIWNKVPEAVAEAYTLIRCGHVHI